MSAKNLSIQTAGGVTDHLELTALPEKSLLATNGEKVDLSKILGLVVIYIYPMTSQPGTPQPKDWDIIPGAKGCTPQSCSFRDHFAEL